MAFARKEIEDDTLDWSRIQARLEQVDGEQPEEEIMVDGLASDDDDDDDDEDENGATPRAGGRSTDGARSAPSRRPMKALPRCASPEVAEKRLPKIKAAAEKMKRVKRLAINADKKHRVGARLFDPRIQKFGHVVYSAPGYVRIAMRDGTQTTVGKPPLEDRKSFIHANFERMENKEMAEILDISVHTMRRLCHEYGLKRHGRSTEQRKTA